MHIDVERAIRRSGGLAVGRLRLDKPHASPTLLDCHTCQTAVPVLVFRETYREVKLSRISERSRASLCLHAGLATLGLTAVVMGSALASAEGANEVSLPCAEDRIATFEITWANGEVRTEEDATATARDLVDTKLVEGKSGDYTVSEVSDDSASPEQTVIAVEDESSGETAALLGVEQLADGDFRTEVVKVCQ